MSAGGKTQGGGDVWRICSLHLRLIEATCIPWLRLLAASSRDGNTRPQKFQKCSFSELCLDSSPSSVSGVLFHSIQLNIHFCSCKRYSVCIYLTSSVYQTLETGWETTQHSTEELVVSLPRDGNPRPWSKPVLQGRGFPGFILGDVRALDTHSNTFPCGQFTLLWTAAAQGVFTNAGAPQYLAYSRDILHTHRTELLNSN